MGVIFGAMDRTLTLRLDGELADNLLAISGTANPPDSNLKVGHSFLVIADLGPTKKA